MTPPPNNFAIGICIYCGQKAGLFKDHHKECAVKRLQDKAAGKGEIQDAVANSIINQTDFTVLSEAIDTIGENRFLTSEEKQESIYAGFDKAVSAFMEDNFLSSEEETKIALFQKHFNYTNDQLDINQSFDLILKSSALRQLSQGEHYIWGNGTLEMPIVLQKDERLAWVFVKSKLFQPLTKTTFVGRSNGVSVRIASGLYYRMGRSSGEPQTSTEMKLIGDGVTFLTNKSIYFYSALKTVKIPYDKIISIGAFTEGTCIQKDGANSKPYIFTNIDSGFLQNLIAATMNGSNLSNK